MPAPMPLTLLTRLAAADSGLMAGMVLDRGTAVFVPGRRESLRRCPPTQTAGVFFFGFAIFTVAGYNDGGRGDEGSVSSGVASGAAVASWEAIRQRITTR
jgi:hypothetical protein